MPHCALRLRTHSGVCAQPEAVACARPDSQRARGLTRRMRTPPISSLLYTLCYRPLTRICDTLVEAHVQRAQHACPPAHGTVAHNRSPWHRCGLSRAPRWHKAWPQAKACGSSAASDAHPDSCARNAKPSSLSRDAQRKQLQQRTGVVFCPFTSARAARRGRGNTRTDHARRPLCTTRDRELHPTTLPGLHTQTRCAVSAACSRLPQAGPCCSLSR